MRALLPLLLALAACAPGGTAPTTVAVGEEARVRSVTDGDTFDIAGDTVRLIGINAPEWDECWGTEATDALADLLGDDVRLELDVEARDPFGRLLAYAWNVDGVFVNEAMVAGGHALARAYEPNTTRQPSLDEAEASAIDADAGLWGACASSTSSVVVARFEADPPGPDDEDLNGEWVELRNEGDTRVDLRGWSLRDESASNRYEFGDTVLEPGGSVVVRTGCGTDTAGEVFWCNDTPVWSNGGDTIFLLDAAGLQVDVVSYGG